MSVGCCIGAIAVRSASFAAAANDAKSKKLFLASFQTDTKVSSTSVVEWRILCRATMAKALRGAVELNRLFDELSMRKIAFTFHASTVAASD
jgi:hypothetical protein